MPHDLATNIPPVLKTFQIKGSCLVLREISTGHIHRTFLGKWTSGNYVHQRLNHHVFQNIEGVTQNISVILRHLQSKMNVGSTLPGEILLEIIPTATGEILSKDTDGYWWRTYRYIEDTESFEVCANDMIAFEAARMFGLFQARLRDLPPNSLIEPIPDFMNCKKRLIPFREAIQKDVKNRGAEIMNLVSIIQDHEQLFDLLSDKRDAGHQAQPTHGDMKLNNLLFSKKTEKAVAVIDLDTCMQGSYLFDFGDMVRTACAAAKEDEADVGLVNIREDLFAGIASGYGLSMGAFLTRYEKEHLVDACMLLPLALGVRFLTDYLNGDTYFRIEYPEHNLVRARSQLALAERIHHKKVRLKKILTKYIK